MIVSRFFLCLRQYITQADKLNRNRELIFFCLQMFLSNLLEVREVFDYKFMHKQSKFPVRLSINIVPNWIPKEWGKDYDVSMISIWVLIKRSLLIVSWTLASQIDIVFSLWFSKTERIFSLVFIDVSSFNRENLHYIELSRWLIVGRPIKL